MRVPQHRNHFCRVSVPGEPIFLQSPLASIDPVLWEISLQLDLDNEAWSKEDLKAVKALSEEKWRLLFKRLEVLRQELMTITETPLHKPIRGLDALR